MLLFAKTLLWTTLFLGASLSLSAAEEKKAKTPEAKRVTLEIKNVHPDNFRLSKAIHAGDQLAPAGWKLYQLPILDEKTRKKIGQEPILLSRRNIVTGEHVKKATPVPSRYGTLLIRLDEKGGKRLSNATKQMRMGLDRMAVVLSGNALIAPIVNGTLSRSIVIEGLDGAKEVEKITQAFNPPLSK